MISGGAISRYLPTLALAGAVVLAAFSGCRGYHMGYDQAEVEGQASIAGLRREYAESMARAERVARERLQAEIARADAVAAELAAANVKHSTIVKDLKARIAHVTHNSDHTFSVDFVRLYNEAIGAGAGDIYASGNPAGPENDSAAASSSDAGLLAAESGVSEADLLAHITDYGGRCLDMEARLRGWIDLAEGWKHEP